jgi:enamine deaminase RidA (YjgF/YER057c/UK114 family)
VEILRRENYPAVRFYVTDIAHSQDCLKAYSGWFRDIKPAITLVEVAALARVDRLVEVEAEAFIGAYRTSRLTEQGLI